MQIGTALSGGQKTSETTQKSSLFEVADEGGNEFGRFSSVNASFWSEAGIALTFLFTFCVKTKSKELVIIE
jgi:hypothetical protein